MINEDLFMNNIFVSAIIVAAGNSTRMGKDKIFLPLNKIPAIAYTLRAFEKSEAISEIIVVGKKGHEAQLKSIASEYSISKFKNFAPGGEFRQESVFSGVKFCSEQTEYFAIHDAARCLITSEEIDESIADAIVHKASSLGIPCKDTLKILNNDNFVISTPDRSTLWNIQTPQVFEKNLYIDAMLSAIKSGVNYTDDCQLIEKMGKMVHIVKGSYSNLKLTTPDDIAVFENILNLRGKSL